MMWSTAGTHPTQAHVIAALLQVQTLQQLLYGLQKHTNIYFLLKCFHLQVKQKTTQAQS